MVRHLFLDLVLALVRVREARSSCRPPRRASCQHVFLSVDRSRCGHPYFLVKDRSIVVPN
jgi:hypothetical protein